MSETREDLIEALASATTDEVREVISGILSHIADVRKAGEQHAFEGVKVPIKPKPRKAMVNSLADAAMTWAVMN